MNKKRICCLLCVISIAGLAVTAMIVVTFNSQEIIRDVETYNSTGTKGSVFVVFRPGLTSFNEDVVDGFVSGLVDADWRVEITTSSQQTPTNVSAYDLIVLGSPTNGAQPHQAMQDYLTRVNLLGKPVVLIITSGGIGLNAVTSFRNSTINANGIVHSELMFHIFESDAIDRAYTAGTEISLES